jgi:pyruvate formate lyase activating enzyme
MMKPLRAPVFDVQRFSIHDGPGIRSLVFFKGCNLQCAWCQNPESQQVAPLVSFYETRCQQCFQCASACPQDAILKQGYRIDHQRCTLCLACVEACPNGALKPIGEYLDPQQLFERILADQAYYESSGGGVTFSGGEPTLHPDFLDAVLDLCNKHGIHTALETCGIFSQARWRTIFPKLQLIYFDLKIMDDMYHKQATGLSNKRILENAHYLASEDYPVEFRLTLVPGFTDDVENLKAIASFVRETGKSEIHLLAYHRMGESKIDIIRGTQKKLGLQNYPTGRLEEIAKWFGQHGIAAHYEK